MSTDPNLCYCSVVVEGPPQFSFIKMNSFQLQILDFTYGFPPVYDFTKNVVGFNYRRALNNFMNGVETVIVFLIAVGVVLRQKWMEYDCTERMQLAAIQLKEFAVNFYIWM